jgi:small subunit ribosomal protein S18
MAYEDGYDNDYDDEAPKSSGGGRRFFTPPPHTCNCTDIDYKNPERLKRYLHENGKIRPRRQTGLCAKCQRKLAREIKRARHLALLPFIGESLH